MSKEAINSNAAFIWSIAEILRGDFKRSKYQKVILPLTVLRRLDAVLDPKKAEFLARAEQVKQREGAKRALSSYASDIYGRLRKKVDLTPIDNLGRDLQGGRPTQNQDQGDVPNSWRSALTQPPAWSTAVTPASTLPSLWIAARMQYRLSDSSLGTTTAAIDVRAALRSGVRALNVPAGSNRDTPASESRSASVPSITASTVSCAVFRFSVGTGLRQNL